MEKMKTFRDTIMLNINGFYYCSDDEDDYENYEDQVQIYREDVGEKIWKKLLKFAVKFNKNKKLNEVVPNFKFRNEVKTAEMFFEYWICNPIEQNISSFSPISCSRDGTVEEFEIEDIIILSQEKVIA